MHACLNQATTKDIAKIKTLSNQDLHSSLDREFKNERGQTMFVVHHMREADRRRLWAAHGFDSFRWYCIKSFKISDNEFYQKLTLMKTIVEMPEVEERILDGSLTTAVVAKASTFFHRVSKDEGRKITTDEKRNLLDVIDGKSERAVEQELASRAPTLPPPDKKKFISREKVLNQYVGDVALDEKFERLKSLLMASLPRGATKCEVEHAIYDIALKAIDPLRKLERIGKRKIAENKRKTFSNVRPLPHKRGYQGVAVKRALFERSKGRCEFVSKITGQQCDHHGHLQIDHIVPLGKGGSDAPENLRYLCVSHNQLTAIEDYGLSHMSKFIPNLKSPVKNYFT